MPLLGCNSEHFSVEADFDDKSSCKTKRGKAKYACPGDHCQEDDVCGEGMRRGHAARERSLKAYIP